MGKKIRTVPRGSIEALQRYHWPGNIRELRNLIEQAVIISDSEVLKINVPLPAAHSPLAFLTLEEAEYMHIVQTLEQTGWRIKGPRGAAALLGLKPSTLYARMSKLNIPTRREKDDILTYRRNSDLLAAVLQPPFLCDHAIYPLISRKF